METLEIQVELVYSGSGSPTLWIMEPLYTGGMYTIGAFGTS